MKKLLRFFQPLYFIYALSMFVVIMLLIFPFVVIASFFGRIKGGNMTYRLCMLWGDLCFFFILVFSKRIFEAPHDPGKAYIFVSNHTSYADAGFLVKVFRQPLRILGKKEMTKIPVFGFIYRNVVVTVDRNDVGDRAQSIRIIKSLINKKISVLVFPEGTFNKTGKPLKEFYNGAFRVAIETQTAIKPVLFLDSYDRIPGSILRINPGKCRAVFLEEIPVAGLTTGDLQALKQKTFDILSNKLREYKASWIRPDKQSALS
jgi:1-acyl-sn-glycerol-3-phosphate acyltransferase